MCDLGQFGTIIGQRHENAIGPSFDIAKGSLNRGGGIGLLPKPVGVDACVDEYIGVTFLDRGNFGGRKGGIDELFVGAVLDVDPCDRQLCDIVGDRCGVVAVSVFDVDADVALQAGQRRG